MTSTIAVPISVGILRRKLLCIRSRRHRTGIGAYLLDRADSDAIGLTQSAIDRSGLGYPHLGATDQERHVRWVSIAIPDKARGILGRIHGRLEDEAIRRGITQRIDSLDVDTPASFATRQPKESGVRHVPGIVEELEFTSIQRKVKILR
jgi:hypothetical protein